MKPIRSVPAKGIPLESLQNGGWQNYDLPSMEKVTQKGVQLSLERRQVMQNIDIFSDKIRLLTLLLLEKEPRGAMALVHAVNALGLFDEVSQPGISHHTAIAKKAGIVDTERSGKNNICSLTSIGSESIGMLRTIQPKEGFLTLHSPSLKEDVVLSSTIAGLIADPVRMKVFECLRSGRKNVTQMTVEIDMTQPAVSHHLSLLLKQGLLHQQKEGKSMFYSLTPEMQSHLLAVDTLTQAEKEKR